MKSIPLQWRHAPRTAGKPGTLFSRENRLDFLAPTRAAELSAVLARRSDAIPDTIAADARELVLISVAAFKWEEFACNGFVRDGSRDFTEADAAQRDSDFAAYEARALQILAPYGVQEVAVGADVRNNRGAGMAIRFTGSNPPSNSFMLNKWEV